MCIRDRCFPVEDISFNRGPAKGVIAMRLDPGDRVHAFLLSNNTEEGLTVTTPRGRDELIRPGRKYNSSRATKGRTIIKKGRFKPWTLPIFRYDTLHTPDQMAEGGEE